MAYKKGENYLPTLEAMWLPYLVTVAPLIQQRHKLRSQRAGNASFVHTVELIPLSWGEQLTG